MNLKYFFIALITVFYTINLLAYVDPGKTPFSSGNVNIHTNVDKAKEIKNISTSQDIRGVVYAWINFVLGLLGIISLVIIIFYAYKAVVLSHDESNVKKLYKIIIYMFFGFLTILFSYLIINTLI